MLGKINPKQIEEVMKRMGIAQTSIDAKRVIIELENKRIIIDEPSVTKVKMQGQTTFQIGGEEREESLNSEEELSEEDIEMVINKTKKSREEVVEFLKKNNGDIALAIMKLK